MLFRLSHARFCRRGELISSLARTEHRPDPGPRAGSQGDEGRDCVPGRPGAQLPGQRERTDVDGVRFPCAWSECGCLFVAYRGPAYLSGPPTSTTGHSTTSEARMLRVNSNHPISPRSSRVLTPIITSPLSSRTARCLPEDRYPVSAVLASAHVTPELTVAASVRQAHTWPPLPALRQDPHARARRLRGARRAPARAAPAAARLRAHPRSTRRAHPRVARPRRRVRRGADGVRECRELADGAPRAEAGRWVRAVRRGAVPAGHCGLAGRRVRREARGGWRGGRGAVCRQFVSRPHSRADAVAICLSSRRHQAALCSIISSYPHAFECRLSFHSVHGVCHHKTYGLDGGRGRCRPRALPRAPPSVPV